MRLKKSTNFLLFFKLKNKKHNYIIKNKKNKQENSFSFLIKIVCKNISISKTTTTGLFYKTIIKFYFFVLKFLKLLVYNKKMNKFSYSSNFNKLKNKIIISKFPSLKKNKTKKKIIKSVDIKKINMVIAFLFSFCMTNFYIYIKRTKLNKIYIFSNFFYFIINIIEKNINI